MEIRIYDQETTNEVDRIHLHFSEEPTKEDIKNILSTQYDLDTVFWSIM